MVIVFLAQEAILEIQQAEREDSAFSHKCLFCRDVFTRNRALLFQHMLEDHSFNVGQPDNLGIINLLKIHTRLGVKPCLHTLIQLKPNRLKLCLHTYTSTNLDTLDNILIAHCTIIM